jgi:streptogramin lyase
VTSFSIFAFRRAFAPTRWTAAVGAALLCTSTAAVASVVVPHAKRPAPTFTVYASGQTPGLPSGAAPFGIVGGPDGNVWFTEPAAGNGAAGIGMIVPSTGAVTQFLTGLQSVSDPSAIVAGGDGNLWYTDMGRRSIGRITPKGAITNFTQGLSADDTPAGLTTAADGSLWFVSFGQSGPYVGHVALDGTITEVAHFDASLTSNPSIGIDKAGNVWFTGTNAKADEYLGEITAQGKAVVHNLALQAIFLPCCANQSTQAFATDANGLLWFADLFYGGAKGGLTPFGRIGKQVRFLGKTGTFVASIALGSDHNIWFANQNPFFINAGIGVLNEDGSRRNYFDLPDKSSPVSIIGGPDGNLWMTAINGSGGVIIKAAI